MIQLSPGSQAMPGAEGGIRALLFHSCVSCDLIVIGAPQSVVLTGDVKKVEGTRGINEFGCGCAMRWGTVDREIDPTNLLPLVTRSCSALQEAPDDRGRRWRGFKSAVAHRYARQHPNPFPGKTPAIQTFGEMGFWPVLFAYFRKHWTISHAFVIMR